MDRTRRKGEYVFHTVKKKTYKVKRGVEIQVKDSNKLFYRISKSGSLNFDEGKPLEKKYRDLYEIVKYGKLKLKGPGYTSIYILEGLDEPVDGRYLRRATEKEKKEYRKKNGINPHKTPSEKAKEKVRKLGLTGPYFANFKANNGTHWGRDAEFSNMEKAIKDVRGTAESERFSGNTASWYVYSIDKYNRPIVVAAGYIDRRGVSKRDYDKIGEVF